MIMDEKTIEIINAVDEAAKFISPGEYKEIVCPDCGGVLFVERALYNGHLHANCQGCGFVVME